MLKRPYIKANNPELGSFMNSTQELSHNFIQFVHKCMKKLTFVARFLKNRNKELNSY